MLSTKDSRFTNFVATVFTADLVVASRSSDQLFIIKKIFRVMKERLSLVMPSTQQTTTLILVIVAVGLLAYVLKQELGVTDKALGFRSKPPADCSKISPSHADWARCAQGTAIGRVPTKNPSSAIKNTSLDFVSDSLRNQGLGVGRLQDGFVQDQYASSLGAPRLGGMRIDKSDLRKKARGALTAQTKSEEGAAFPFATKSGPERGEVTSKTMSSGPVSGTETLGMGMSFDDFKQKPRAKQDVRDSRRSLRSQVDKKLGVAPFDDLGAEHNPFASGSTSVDLGSRLKVGDGSAGSSKGLKLNSAFGGGLGAAVSPVSSVGVSPDEISAATASLNGVNIVQSLPTAHIDRFIRQ